MNNNNKIFIVLMVILKDFQEPRLNYYRKIKENKIKKIVVLKAQLHKTAVLLQWDELYFSSPFWLFWVILEEQFFYIF